MNRQILFCLGAFALTASVLCAHQPPRDLHLVGDHWTAWNPPTSFPEGAEIYTIQRGDTLWDLAGRFFGNPYLWPQIWERNPYILDAHWIYPGDPLVVSVEVTPIEEVVAAAEVPEEEEEEAFRLGSGIGPPVALGSQDDIYCSGYIGELEELFPRQIIGSEYQRLNPTLVVPSAQTDYESGLGEIDTVKIELSVGDVVYVDGGQAAGLFPGDSFTIISPRERVEHPITGDTIGRFYGYVGRLRVLSVQEESAIAEIVHSCMPAHVGAGLVPFEAEPVPLVRRKPMVGFNDPVSADALEEAPVIVRSESGVVSIGQDHVVWVDRGLDEVAPGDIFTVYRLNRKGLPPVVMGELGILSVHQKSAVAKVLESRYTIRLGDPLDPKP
jgi:hypothetical protein